MYEKLVQKQVLMRRVLIALLPLYAFALYLYGLHLVFLSLIVFPLGIGVEYLFERTRKKKVSEAVFVTCMLYVLSLPPLVPWWIAGLGILFAVFIAKEVFGGFGRNVFNPAIAGRLFVYITFSPHMTSGWILGGNFASDAVSSATPLAQLGAGQSPDLLNLLLGFHAGSMGESPIILILLAAIFLAATKTAKANIMISTVGAAILFSYLLEFAGVSQALPALPALLSGSLVFVAVFMATDPVSAPKKMPAQIIYGVLIGSITVLIRMFPLFREGTSFAVLLGNTFAPLLDQIFSKAKT
ncbi:MAG: RnfABCDGE type electron transport complex subunit D [Spirochaetales bacterium]|nr:RnfABCDGE type electron transport complex subunit D [Spirochaetales bacterium]